MYSLQPFLISGFRELGVPKEREMPDKMSVEKPHETKQFHYENINGDDTSGSEMEDVFCPGLQRFYVAIPRVPQSLEGQAEAQKTFPNPITFYLRLCWTSRLPHRRHHLLETQDFEITRLYYLRNTIAHVLHRNAISDWTCYLFTRCFLRESLNGNVRGFCDRLTISRQ